MLKGDNSVGEFYSVALTNHKQQADTGTKMVHVGKNTRSRIVSKGISAGNSVNAYRGLVQIQPTARGARNYSQCDSMLIGDEAGANTYPYIQVRKLLASRVVISADSCLGHISAAMHPWWLTKLLPRLKALSGDFGSLKVCFGLSLLSSCPGTRAFCCCGARGLNQQDW